MHLRDLHRNAPKPSAGAVIVGPWPSYAAFKHLPEQQRWVLYGSAKAYRGALEDQGIQMAESYDEFIKRVTDELEI
ncbi:hypothetical protein [Stutzerimonas stutzeri]|uniref:hypothetical protein n=1 Tax=Stutzerimonas stutzeri TaxID=316 RepID=UPI002657AC68|nr:hypothetical protein [Stutzerimonas stutzeri]MCF6780892.1 hypothetical protein [Stutzerimonas stutzeri]MCF6803462.1 hypothetical protein [Stutzerimonas stutzeri]